MKVSNVKKWLVMVGISAALFLVAGYFMVTALYSWFVEEGFSSSFLFFFGFALFLFVYGFLGQRGGLRR